MYCAQVKYCLCYKITKLLIVKAVHNYNKTIMKLQKVRLVQNLNEVLKVKKLQRFRSAHIVLCIQYDE